MQLSLRGYSQPQVLHLMQPTPHPQGSQRVDRFDEPGAPSVAIVTGVGARACSEPAAPLQTTPWLSLVIERVRKVLSAPQRPQKWPWSRAVLAYACASRSTCPLGRHRGPPSSLWLKNSHTLTIPERDPLFPATCTSMRGRHPMPSAGPVGCVRRGNLPHPARQQHTAAGLDTVAGPACMVPRAIGAGGHYCHTEADRVGP